MFRLIVSMLVLALSGCAGIPALVDKSKFEVFEYRLRGALGFCPEIDDIVAAKIDRDDEENCKVVLTIVTELNIPLEPGSSRCPSGTTSARPSIYEGACYRSFETAERRLTQQEISRMDGVFGRLGLWFGSIQFGESCDIDTYRWDEFAASGCCDPNRLSTASQTEIDEFINDLRID